MKNNVIFKIKSYFCGENDKYSMSCYSVDTISKIGNAIIYLAERIPDLGKTKLLKLLYLLEEHSILYNKSPFFGLEFEVWHLGPVAKDIFIEFDEPNMLDEYISINKYADTGYKTSIIKPKKEFDDSEFSDNDILLLDKIIDNFGSNTAKQLVDITHRKGSLWHKAADENKLLEHFEKKSIISTPIKIDLSELISGCDKERYNENLESKKIFDSLN